MRQPPRKTRRTTTGKKRGGKAVAKKLRMDRVTPRAIAYAAVQVCTLLHPDAPSDLCTSSSLLLHCPMPRHGVLNITDSTSLKCTRSSLIFLKMSRLRPRRGDAWSYLPGGTSEFFCASDEMVGLFLFQTDLSSNHR